MALKCRSEFDKEGNERSLVPRTLSGIPFACIWFSQLSPMWACFGNLDELGAKRSNSWVNFIIDFIFFHIIKRRVQRLVERQGGGLASREHHCNFRSRWNGLPMGKRRKWKRKLLSSEMILVLRVPVQLDYYCSWASRNHNFAWVIGLSDIAHTRH